ncbi:MULTISPECIES: SDR family oxidoreductase [unclassified Acinetobacter]|uniref:SDR family NAD(P)-dependent oxidoreductase n=1 Tax=unclassified Acinetobacter TaxID=196816 RepID=UPI0029340E52|nr:MULTISPECIES: SDR family oxidoreductase [unclassified Acinetobacter]WOE33379.1 SDR family oxidoreductase [Acinetobacter sp. SAAs470]WOE36924.1 SDR family oxidoreductase [Acinetobacter sp. SAAs474]
MKSIYQQVEYLSLKNKVILITGGASGIGAAFVEAFVCQDAKVAFLDINEDDALLLQKKFNKKKYKNIFYQFCDVTDINMLKNCIKNIEDKWSGIDILINNAASDIRHDFIDITQDDWDESINLNLRHYFFAIQSVVDSMEKRGGGSIINVGSISWMQGISNLICYTTAKAAIHGMTRSLARQLGEKNIRVNNLIPGAIKTPKQDKMWEEDKKGLKANNSLFIKKQMLKSRLIPSDCARLALFLASDESYGCTAQDFIIDAGLLFQD